MWSAYRFTFGWPEADSGIMGPWGILLQIGADQYDEAQCSEVREGPDMTVADTLRGV